METGRISEGADGSSGSLSSGSDNGESGQFRIDNSYSVSGALKPPLAGSKKGFFPSFFQRLTGPEPARAKGLKTGLKIEPKNRVENRPSGAEDDGVHDPPRQQREQARDH